MLEKNKNRLIILSVVLYELSVVLFAYKIKTSAGLFSLLPILTISWFYGVLPSVIVSVFFFLLNYINFFVLINVSQVQMPDVLAGFLQLVIAVLVGLAGTFQRKFLKVNRELQEKNEYLSNAIDIKNKAENRLVEKLEHIRIITKISSDFINIHPLQIELRIKSTLEMIASLIGAERGYIFLESENKTYELMTEYFCPNCIPLSKKIMRFETDQFEDILVTLRNGAYIEVNTAFWKSPLKNVFNAAKIIFLPLLSSEKLIGFVGYDSKNENKNWDKEYIELLTLSAHAISNAIQRKKSDDKITAQYNELSLKSIELVQSNREMKKLNQKLTDISKELYESEKKFRELAENIEDVIWLQEGRKFLYINPAYERVWGSKREILYERANDFVDKIHPEEKREMVKEFVYHDYDREGVFQKEFRLVDSKGNVKWIYAKAFPIAKINGSYRVAGIAQDITLRKKVEEEIKKALDKAIELNQLKSRFISMVSHEIRTPLTAIQTSAEILQLYRNKLTKSEAETHFNNIFTSIESMISMLNDITSLSKSDMQEVQPRYEEIDVYDMINELAENFKLLKNTDVIVDLKGERFTAELDPKLFSQVAYNIISNAVKFSPAVNKVWLTLSSGDKEFSLTVKDEGIGIPEYELKDIFNPFFRAANAVNYNGTGLGLTIVKRWTEALKGRIEIKSKLNKGTTVTVTFPLRRSD
ncbi:PAS domain-containing sensor histidine kinase [Melioribacter sp. Ez-97]|uniref:sensor histidine kinase n=1 Tax=Melioribacter sp. Ez-97 TaxID=3423434 RepID=UPI003EDA607C